jgi:hypothetical protein
MNTALSIWLLLAAISLSLTAIHDHRAITPRKVLVGLTFGPVAVVLGAMILAAAVFDEGRP